MFRFRLDFSSYGNKGRRLVSFLKLLLIKMYYYPVGCVNKIIDFPLVAGPGFAPGSRDYEPRMITTSLPRGNVRIIP